MADPKGLLLPSRPECVPRLHLSPPLIPQKGHSLTPPPTPSSTRTLYETETPRTYEQVKAINKKIEQRRVRTQAGVQFEESPLKLSSQAPVSVVVPSLHLRERHIQLNVPALSLQCLLTSFLVAKGDGFKRDALHSILVSLKMLIVLSKKSSGVCKSLMIELFEDYFRLAGEIKPEEVQKLQQSLDSLGYKKTDVNKALTKIKGQVYFVKATKDFARREIVCANDVDIRNLLRRMLIPFAVKKVIKLSGNLCDLRDSLSEGMKTKRLSRRSSTHRSRRISASSSLESIRQSSLFKNSSKHKTMFCVQGIQQKVAQEAFSLIQEWYQEADIAPSLENKMLGFIHVVQASYQLHRICAEDQAGLKKDLEATVTTALEQLSIIWSRDDTVYLTIADQYRFNIKAAFYWGNSKPNWLKAKDGLTIHAILDSLKGSRASLSKDIQAQINQAKEVVDLAGLTHFYSVVSNLENKLRVSSGQPDALTAEGMISGYFKDVQLPSMPLSPLPTSLSPASGRKKRKE